MRGVVCALVIVLVTGAVAMASAQVSAEQAALDSYTSWLHTGVDNLVAEGAISPQLAEAVRDPSGDPMYRKALALAQQGDVQAAIGALLELSRRQTDILAVLHQAAADNREWVVAQMLAWTETVPEALAARKYITEEQKREFILRRPVDWSLPTGRSVTHGPWQPPEAGETSPALTIKPGENLPYNPAALAAFYGPPPTGLKYPRMPSGGSLPYDPAELVRFYGPASN